MRIEVDNTSANARGKWGLGFDAIMAIDVAEESYDEGIMGSSSPPLTLARPNNYSSQLR